MKDPGYPKKERRGLARGRCSAEIGYWEMVPTTAIDPEADGRILQTADRSDRRSQTFGNVQLNDS